MSLSKLSSSGASPQDAFGQNPFSERQHPLLLPTVLDTVFTYLNFEELKNSRLVCKSWSEVAIPFIGRRKLKPVYFYQVKFEDLLALKQEFQDSSKPHPKLKLFQGFGLHWEEVVAMSYCNFMHSFKPSQLSISGRNICNPATNLNLLQPLLTTLKHLSLEIILDSSYSCRSFTGLLNNFAQLQTMNLKIFQLEITAKEWGAWLPGYYFTREEVDAIYRAFERVFQSQSPTLEELVLKFQCVVSKHKKLIEGIKLPVFPCLQDLTLALDIKETRTEEYLSIFVPFDFCVKFPRLVQLNILDSTLNTMDEDAIVLTRGHTLMKKLTLSENEYSFETFDKVDENIEIFENLHLSFPFIEELKIEETPLLYLILGGIEISWLGTLKVLECFGPRLDFNFGHLKKLEYLRYTFTGDIDFGTEEFQIASFIEMLLEHHDQLPHLKCFHLVHEDNLPPPEKMNQILEALPEEFRSIFKFTNNEF